MKKQLVFNIGLILILLMAVSVSASNDTIGSHGIHSDVLMLTGDGISIGQVELRRPGKPGFDNATNSNFGTTPVEVYLLDDRVSPTANAADELYDINGDPHTTWVAGVMISADPIAPGVATGADLYASHGTYFTTPFIPSSDSLAITSQFIATRNDDDVRAINMSFAIPFDLDGQPDGNSKLTEFIDWSATTHDVLYVVANKNDLPIGNAAQPSDNFNGMTVAASAKVGDVYRQVADFVDISFDATGPRTSISLLAPGANVEVADVGGTIPAPSVDGSSFAAPHVTGTVALLQQHAENKILSEGTPQWTGNARRHEVMKAVLMNSADKIQGILGMERTVLKQNGVDTWADSDAALDDEIPLDEQMGAGHLNAKRAYQQFDPGEYGAGGAAVPAIGWDYGATADIDDIQTYALAQSIPANQYVSITLAWDRDVLLDLDFDGDGAFDIGDEFLDSSVPTDLNLYLVPAGMGIAQAVAKSIATDTSVEHIFAQISMPGMYEIWVEQAGGSLFGDQSYALAWMTTTPTDLVLGDYSGDGTIGPEDYTVWKSNFGSTTQLAADGNGNGTVDAADYTIWRDNLGAGSGSLAAVPEPATSMLLLIAIVVLPNARSRRLQSAA